VAEERVQRRLAAILDANVVGYCRLMREDEGETLAQIKSLRSELIEPKVAEFGGRFGRRYGGLRLHYPPQ
jgi:adenylate cyclase